MSRGVGRTMVEILTALDAVPEVWLADLAEPSTPRYRSLWRAAWRLFEMGKLTISRGGLSHSALLLCRPGHRPAFRLRKCVVGRHPAPTTHLAIPIEAEVCQ
jgi:hypothetical protein